MAEKGVAGVGQGFFSEAGKLKSKEEIRVEEQKAGEARKARAAAAQPPVDTSELSDQKIGEAFSRVRARFNEQANQAVSAVNQEQEDLRAARKVVKEQLAAARDLEQALENGDKEAAQVSRKKLEELQSKRNELSEQISSRDEEQLAVRRQTVSVGNEKLATVQIPQVKLEKSQDDIQAIDRPKEARQLEKSLKDELAALNAVGQELRETRREVRQVVSEGNARIAALEEGTIRDFEKAQETATRVASDIRSSSREQAFNAVGSLGTEIVRQLISG